MLLLSAKYIQDLISYWKTPYERRFGTPFNGSVIQFGAMVEHHLLRRKTDRDCINLVQKSSQEDSLEKRLHAEGNLERRHSIFQSQMEQLEISGGDQRLRTSTLIQIVLQKEKNKKSFKESQADSLIHSHINMTQHWMMRKLKLMSGLLREISFIAITWNPMSNCTCREKNHFLFR